MGGKPSKKTLQEDPENIPKCLILGAGYSGKSTCYKHQIWNQFEKKEAEAFAQSYLPILLDQYQRLLQALCDFHVQQTGKLVVHVPDVEHETSQALLLLKHLWKQYGSDWPLPLGASLGEGLFMPDQHFCLRTGVNESSKYLMNRAEALLTGDLVQKRDVLCARVLTTGIVEGKFSVQCGDGEQIDGKIYDLGGPRNERKKWVHCFLDVSIVVYVVDLASYCFALYEDENVCSLVEQLELFAEIVGSRWLNDTTFCLLFNHLDRFLQLAPVKPFNTDVFENPPKITLGKEWEGVEYIQSLFLQRWVPKEHHPLPFVVTTSLANDNPLYFHKGSQGDILTVLVDDVTLPAVLWFLVAEYATSSDVLITPPIAESIRAVVCRHKKSKALDITSPKQEARVDMGGLTCQRHTYSPQDQVR